MNIIIITLAIIVIAVIVDCYKNKDEKFGALTQLYAKGPQDVYLTANIEKYIPEIWYNGNYYPLFWNAPTRYPRNPYYLPYLYDEYYWRYPYVRFY